MRKLTIVAAAAIAGALLSACGEDQAAKQQESATRELQQAQRELRKERRRLKREREKDSAGTSSPDESNSDTPSGGERGRVPDVEGKDHQLAQDTMQAAGFYNLSEEDASGEDRPLIYDRNWTVVSQSPNPGTRASLDRTIVLKAKRDGE
jgi:beta-lactam-binding protein with PASTA domain